MIGAPSETAYALEINRKDGEEKKIPLDEAIERIAGSMAITEPAAASMLFQGQVTCPFFVFEYHDANG